MKKFYWNKKHIEIYNDDGSVLLIHLMPDSGKIFYRLKINTLTDVKHTGVYLGVDMSSGVHYFIHNHYEFGRPSIVTLSEFTKGRDFYPYTPNSSNTPLKVLEIALNEVLRGEVYHPTNYNCQTLINIACNNKRVSEDVEKWSSRILLASLCLLGMAVFSD